MQATNTVILIQGLLLHVRVGVPRAERKLPQSIAIDIEIVRAKAPEGDIIAETVNYADIVRELKELARTERDRLLLETFAREIAEICLAEPEVERVQVTLRKLQKLESCAAVGVRMTFAK